ncbi:FadR/GntR family transcriptional regulator [Corynebacterium uterequi]|uniref:Transcriptional regulator, GntR family n=1 Tax=Corynebacterium uterequi TaxID=1072256 RepID=A0A0G3HEW3_9CORY|nr:FCD domain-containing protein [Corynebacterium uterequi]AKK11844.1 transcriptional regulator, GntR family [Corynebacterium uterequi]
MTAPRRSQTVTGAAVDAIKAYIRDAHLRPGDALPTEAELCDKLGYSRSSVREAVRILSALDIVVVRHGHGTYVSDMSLQPLVNGLVFRTVLAARESLAFLGHVVDAREALDLSLAAELTGAVDAATLSELEDIVDQMRSQVAQGRPFTDEDQRFHQLLLSGVDNTLIKELSQAFWQVHAEVMPLLEMEVVAVENRDRTVSAHQEIIDALRAEDRTRFRAAIRSHYAPLRDVISQSS